MAAKDVVSWRYNAIRHQPEPGRVRGPTDQAPTTDQRSIPGSNASNHSIGKFPRPCWRNPSIWASAHFSDLDRYTAVEKTRSAPPCWPPGLPTPRSADTGIAATRSPTLDTSQPRLTVQMLWRTPCVKARTPGSASGPQKRTGGNANIAWRADSTTSPRERADAASGLRPGRRWRGVHVANLDALLPPAGISKRQGRQMQRRMARLRTSPSPEARNALRRPNLGGIF